MMVGRKKELQRNQEAYCKPITKKALISSELFYCHFNFQTGSDLLVIYGSGLVYKVDGTYFYTIEGNTSGVSGVVANGGGVTKKKYSISAYKAKTLFGYPKYDVGGSIKQEMPTIKKGSVGDSVKQWQQFLKAQGYDI